METAISLSIFVIFPLFPFHIGFNILLIDWNRSIQPCFITFGLSLFFPLSLPGTYCCVESGSHKPHFENSKHVLNILIFMGMCKEGRLKDILYSCFPLYLCSVHQQLSKVREAFCLSLRLVFRSSLPRLYMRGVGCDSMSASSFPFLRYDTSFTAMQLDILSPPFWTRRLHEGASPARSHEP